MSALGNENPTRVFEVGRVGRVAPCPARAIYEATLMRMLTQIQLLLIPETSTSIHKAFDATLYLHHYNILGLGNMYVERTVIKENIIYIVGPNKYTYLIKLPNDINRIMYSLVSARDPTLIIRLICLKALKSTTSQHQIDLYELRTRCWKRRSLHTLSKLKPRVM